MKLNSYSKISRMIWDSWGNGKITVDEKDEMLNHILKVPQLEERVWWLTISNIGLGIVSFGLIISLLLCFMH